jgi:phosphoenolpyruvate carboxylase
VFANPYIAAVYNSLLVSPELRPFGVELRCKYEETRSLLLKVAGHEDVLAGNPTLKQHLRLQEPCITVLNVQQAYTFKTWDESAESTAQQNGQPGKPGKQTTELVTLNPMSEYAPGLEDTIMFYLVGS